MKTRVLCVALCALTVFLMMGSVCSMYHAMTPHGQNNISTVLRLASYAADNHPSTMAAQYFAAMVNQQTHGRIRIQVISDGELGEEEAAMEQLCFGGIAFAIVNCLSMSDDMIAAGGDGTLIPDRGTLNMQRLDMLCTFEPDYRCIANSGALLSSDGQCAGVRVGAHTSAVLAERLERLGMDVVPYTGGDLVSSVYYGYIDGLELPLMVYATEEYAKTLPYLSLYNGPASTDVLLSSQVSMGSLSAEDQRIIRACAAEAAQYQRQIIGRRQDEAVAALKGKGVKFYPPETANVPSSDWPLFRSRFIGGGNTDE